MVIFFAPIQSMKDKQCSHRVAQTSRKNIALRSNYIINLISYSSDKFKDANNITWSDTFTGSSLEELEKFLKDSHAKILDVVKQHSESFYEIVKARSP